MFGTNNGSLELKDLRRSEDKAQRSYPRTFEDQPIGGVLDGLSEIGSRACWPV